MRVIAILTTFLLLATSVHADVYMKAKTFSGDSETWTSEKKQRVDVMVPGFGKMSTVTRVDKGVEWQLDIQRGLYQEQPIAVTLTDEERAAEKEITQEGSITENSGISENSGRVGSMQTLPQTKEFLGAQATRYQWVPDDSHSTIWMLPLKGSFAKAEKENEEYQKAYLEALYANYSAKDRKEMMDSMQAIGMTMGKELAGMPGVNHLHEGLAVGMETAVGSENSDQPQNRMVFEMVELNLDPIDGSVFELPQGMRRVNDLGEEQARQMMGPGYAATMQSMQQIPQAQSEEEAGAAMAATMGNALATFGSSEMQAVVQQGADAVQDEPYQEEPLE